MAEALLAAIYARVSSEQQAEDHTIASQVAALRARVAEDELLLPAEREFLDEGYSGASLVRPALEGVRDLIATGGIDRLYVHSPDRLARRYAYQALLLDEFQAAGVEVVFLNHARPGPVAGGRTAAAGPGHGRRIRAGQDSGAQSARQTPRCSGWHRQRLIWSAVRLPLNQERGRRWCRPVRDRP